MLRESTPEPLKTPRIATEGRRRDDQERQPIYRSADRDWVPWERKSPSWQGDQRQYRPPQPSQKPKSLFDLLFKN